MLVSSDLIRAYNIKHGLQRCVIWRFERERDQKSNYHHDWCGPFSDHRFTHLTSMTGIHPTPEEEGIAHSGGSWLVGCDQPGLLLEWFSFHNIGDLYEAGFRLAAYTVSHANHGQFQSVFYRESIESVVRYEDCEEVMDLIQEDYWKVNLSDEHAKRKIEQRAARKERRRQLLAA